MASVQFGPEVIQREDTKRLTVLSPSRQSTFDNTDKINNWISEKSIKGIQERADSDLTRTRAVYDPILHRESTLVKDVNNYLSHRRLTRQRKKEMLHKKWNDRVYEPIAHQIESIMQGGYYPDLRRVRLGEFQNYLDHRNQLGHVFLDTFDVDQYDPMRINDFDRSYDKNKVKFDRSVDPLISQQTFRRNEDQTIFRCETGRVESATQYENRLAPKLPLVPQGRHGIGSREWIKFTEGDIDSKVRFESRKRMRGYLLNGEFDHREWEAPGDRIHSAEWQSEKTDRIDSVNYNSNQMKL